MATGRLTHLAVAGIVLAGLLGPVWGGEVRVVSHVKVVSDKVEDVSSLEARKRSFIEEGMSGREKALAVWASVARSQHQDSPPHEHLQLENTVLAPPRCSMSTATASAASPRPTCRP